MFSRNSSQTDDLLRTIFYTNIQCSHMHFSLRKDIPNHKDILCISFFNCSCIYFLINVYSNSSQLALKYLKDTEVNIDNVLIMTGDFNIRDSFWDPNYPYHSSHKNTLFEIANSFYVELSKPTEFFPTRYSNNSQDSNSVLDLVFLHLNSMEHNNHHIYLEWRLTSDHAPISVNISILKEQVQTRKWSLPKNSEEKAHFIGELIHSIKSLNTNSLLSVGTLKSIVQWFTDNIDKMWHKNSKVVNITKHSKKW